MVKGRQLVDQLKVVTNPNPPTGAPGNQQGSVIETLAIAKPVTATIERHARQNDQLKLTQFDQRGLRARLRGGLGGHIRRRHRHCSAPFFHA